MPLQVIPVDHSQARLQLAQLALLGRGAQQGVDNFQGFQRRQQEMAAQQALAELLAGTPGQPGQGPRLLGPGGTEPDILARALGVFASELQGPPTAPTSGTPGLLPGITPQQAQALAMNPGVANALLQQRFAPPPAPVNVAPGASLVDPITKQAVFTAPAAATSTDQRLAGAGLTPGTPEAREFLLGRPPAAPTVNLPPLEREGQSLAARFVNAVETEQLPAIRKQLNSLDAIKGLLDEGLETGRLAELKSALSNTFGVELDPNSSGLEAARALISSVVISQIGQATFGALSEGERDFLAGTTASTAITPEANRRRLAITKKALKFERRLQQEAARFVDEQGSTAGLDAHLQQWAARHPLPPEPGLGAAPASGTNLGAAAVVPPDAARGLTFDQLLDRFAPGG